MDEKYGFFKALKDLFKYSKENKNKYIIGTIFMIIFVITSMIYTTMNSKLIANIMSLNLDKAIKLVIICALLRIFSITFCHNQYRRIVIKTGEEISATIQKKIYGKLLNLSMASFENMKSGTIFTTIKAADSGMMATISQLLQESAYIATSVAMLFVIYFIDWKIGLGVTAISTLSLLLFKIQLNKSKKYLKDEFEYTDNYSTLVNETNRGFKEIKALDLKEKCFNIFEKDIENLKNTRTTRRLLGKNVNTSKWTIRIIGDAIILLYIIEQLKISVMNIETAMLVITYMTNIVDDVFHRIIEHDFGISEFTANMRRISSLLEDNELEKEKFGTKEYNNIKGNIEFKNITFAYSNDVILKDISFEIKAQKKNALVGMSGSGKTTIFKLLLKQYDNYNGQILIDGHNIKDFSEKSLRNAISVVNQEPMLFNMSIKENLLMVKPDATEEQLQQVCKLASIHEFIETLPHKYDEILLENNNNISVGQKQRIAIARAILKDTPIILFDEVTSALDKESKKNIEETINKISKTKTVIVIAHTLDSIENFDNIVCLKDGGIVEEGSHNDLINEKGMYYNLIKI
jgi:ABC-type multidrug transport system fused ATPase/permease subunit